MKYQIGDIVEASHVSRLEKGTILRKNMHGALLVTFYLRNGQHSWTISQLKRYGSIKLVHRGDWYQEVKEIDREIQKLNKKRHRIINDAIDKDYSQ